jgi:hypothetical protein
VYTDVNVLILSYCYCFLYLRLRLNKWIELNKPWNKQTKDVTVRLYSKLELLTIYSLNSMLFEQSLPPFAEVLIICRYDAIKTWHIRFIKLEGDTIRWRSTSKQCRPRPLHMTHAENIHASLTLNWLLKGFYVKTISLPIEVLGLLVTISPLTNLGWPRSTAHQGWTT